MAKVKMKLLKDDPCFGKDHTKIEQCDACWIKKACSIAQRQNERHAKKDS